MPDALARGLRIQLTPDATLFETVAFDSERLSSRCRDLAMLVPGLRVRFTDHRTGADSRFHYPGGVTERLRELTRDVPRLHPEPFSFEVAWEGLRVEGVLQWCEAEGGLWSYANTVRTRRHGVHVDGVFLALRRALATHTKESVFSFSRERLEGGLRAIIAVDGPDERMAFAGPTKELLAIEGLRDAVLDQLQPVLVQLLREHPVTPWLVAHARVRPKPAVVKRQRPPK